MKILITGSSGMIGTRLFETMLRKGYDTTGLDRKENSWNPSLNDKTLITDLLDANQVENVPKDFDMIIHLAANSRVCKLVEDPKLAMENIQTSFNMLDFARKNNMKFIFSSSREVYGNLEVGEVSKEGSEKLHLSENAYSASKAASEALIHSYSKTFGLEYVIVRYSNIYGMYDNSDRVIPIWIKKALKNQELTLYGKGKSLDFLYIDDAIEGTIKIIEKFREVSGNEFNISLGKSFPLTEIAKLILEISSSQSTLAVKENRKGEIQRFGADNEKASDMLGFYPKHDIKTGMKKTFEWYRKFYEKE